MTLLSSTYTRGPIHVTLRMKGRKRNVSPQQTAKRQCLKKKDERAKSAKKKPKVKDSVVILSRTIVELLILKGFRLLIY